MRRDVRRLAGGLLPGGDAMSEVGSALTCPSCDGAGTIFALVDGPSYRGPKTLTCHRCAGSGRITQAQMDAIESGRRIRENRLERNVSMGEEARRLGMSVSEYSAIEHGRIYTPNGSTKHSGRL